MLLLAGCGPADSVEEIRELQSRGEFAASIEPLRELLETRSDDPEVNYLYGIALSATGLPTQAQWSFRKARDSEQWRAKAALQLASGALATANTESAIENATIVLELEPENLEALMIRTGARVQSRLDYEGALADAELALELDPENSMALSLKGVALFGLERVEEGRVVVEELERRFREENLGQEDTARYCATRAIFLEENDEFEEANAQLDQCLETFPARAVVVNAALEFHDGRREFARSLEILRKALEEAPFSAWRKMLADRLVISGDAEGAEQVLKEGTELEVPDAVLASWVHLSHFYLDQGKMEQGVSALEMALAAGGDSDPQLQFDHAEALVMAGRLDDAESAAAKLSLPAYRELILGRVAFERGDAKQALVHYTEGLRLWPNSAGARYYAALAAERDGDFDRAIAEYRYSIRSDPSATDARLRLARLHAAEGAISLALMTARQGSGRHPSDVDAELFAVRLAARAGSLPDMRAYTAKLQQHSPWLRSLAVAQAAAGLREGYGAKTALRYLLDSKLDLHQPANEPALREMVLCTAEAESSDAALMSVERMLAVVPESADALEIRALALAQTGADPARVRAAYQQVLAVEAEHALALLGLARLEAAAGASDAALGLYARAIAADLEAPEAQREAIELLLSLERFAEAEEQLEALLRAHPYDAAAAISIARMRMARGEQGERSLELAQRAARFGAGADAYDLLSELYGSRGDEALAAEAASQAEEYRSRQRAAAGPPPEPSGGLPQG